MAVHTEMVTIPVGGESFQGYFAVPEGGPFPGIIVVQEIFGVNDHIRAVTEKLADAGYACLAPDLYWRAQPGFTSGYTPDEIASALAVRGKIDDGRAAEDIQAAMQVLIARDECRGMKTGITGFCWGGLMTFVSAARLDPACAVSYYGGRTVDYLVEAGDIKCPILFHYGELDGSIPMEQVEQIKQAVSGLQDATVHTYPDTGHGFNCDMRGDFHPASAEMAWERTIGFFRSHLP